jgi:hypothetical protein
MELKSQVDEIETDGQRASVAGGCDAAAIYRRTGMQRSKENYLYVRSILEQARLSAVLG